MDSQESAFLFGLIIGTAALIAIGTFQYFDPKRDTEEGLKTYRAALFMVALMLIFLFFKWVS